MRDLDFNKGNGLLPVVIQEMSSNEVLMLGFMNREAWMKTKEEGVVWFYSRSKNRLWMKGESSGNVLLVRRIATDCDRDTLLIQVEVKGPVCHLGTKSCFSNIDRGEELR
jgi:phosphoribosyl-AMP cyclohydrolase / phosphoribosyl-ATP pyrophosphohydrolase